MTTLAVAVEQSLDLGARLNAGDPTVFAELVGQFKKPIFNYLLRCGVDRASRDDLLQEIFVRVHRGAATYQPRAPLRAWVFAIAANTMRSHFRRLARERQSMVSGSCESWSGPERTDALVVARETEATIASAVAALPLLQREVLVLSTITDMSQTEIGAVLALPTNTVKTNLRRARLALAKALSGDDGTGGRP